MREFITSYDSFGVPIELKFKGKSQIQSFAGGIVSIICRCIVFYYLCTKVLLLFNQKSNKEILSFSKDIILNPGYHLMTQNKMELAFKLYDFS